MNLKSITAHSAVALSLVSVCSLSHASFFDNLFSSSTKEPVALSATTQEIMKNHPVWVIDGKDTSAWSVVEGKKPRRGAAPLLLKQDRGDLGLIPAQTDAGYVATKTEKISLFQPTSVVFEKNGSALLKFGAGKAPVQIGLKLRAFDVSGLKMAEFLKNRKGQPLAEAEKVFVVDTHFSPAAITPICPPIQGPQLGVLTAHPASTKISRRPSLIHCL